MPATPRDDSPTGERLAAKAARDYHETVGLALPDLQGRRASLAAFAEKFYRDRLGIVPSAREQASLDALADMETVVIEIAHDGQLPHLGVVRMVLKADEIARLDGTGVAIYLVGNHYSPEMRPDNIHFGMPLRGSPPSAVKHPPKLSTGRANAHKPFRWLDPPAASDMEALRSQIVDFLGHNVAHERKTGRAVPEESRLTILERLDHLFEIMNGAVQSVKSLGDWIIRVQHDLLAMLDPAGEARLVFLPMAELTDLFRPELERIFDSEGEVREIKAQVSAQQKAQGLELYSRRPDVSSAWVFCPSCGRRFRTPWTGSSLEFRCPVCRHTEEMTVDEIWRFVMPDIVAYQVGLFRLGVDGWVAGSRAPYHPVIRQLTSRLFGVEAPPTFFVTSVPVFRGLGDPPQGFGKTRLLRALLEMDPRDLANSLRAPWDDDPRPTSQFLKG